MKTIAFVSGSGDAGKTSLVYHLAHMLSRLGYPALAVDLDPLSTLSSLFLGEELLEQIWNEGTHTVFSSAALLLDNPKDIKAPHPSQVTESLWVLTGDPALWSLDGGLAIAYSDWRKENPLAAAGALRLSVFQQLVSRAGDETKSEVALLDMGSGLGSLQRAALLAADFLVFPLAADMFSLHGLKVLGPFVNEWRREWASLRKQAADSPVELPEGRMEPIGYVALRVNQSRMRTRFQANWLSQLPAGYAAEVLGAKATEISPNEDSNCLAVLRNYYSLMSMSQDAHKPMFDLGRADGVMGTYGQIVNESYAEFEALAKSLAARCGLKKSTR